MTGFIKQPTNQYAFNLQFLIYLLYKLPGIDILFLWKMSVFSYLFGGEHAVEANA